jgi:hypothetical protein
MRRMQSKSVKAFTREVILGHDGAPELQVWQTGREHG